MIWFRETKLKHYLSLFLSSILIVQCGISADTTNLSAYFDDGQLEVSNPDYWTKQDYADHPDGHYEQQYKEIKSEAEKVIGLSTSVSYEVKDGDLVGLDVQQKEFQISRNSFDNYMQNFNYQASREDKIIIDTREIPPSHNTDFEAKYSHYHRENPDNDVPDFTPPTEFQHNSGGRIHDREHIPGIGSGPRVDHHHKYENLNALRNAAYKSYDKTKNNLNSAQTESQNNRLENKNKLKNEINKFNSEISNLRNQIGSLPHSADDAQNKQSPGQQQLSKAQGYYDFAKSQLDSGSLSKAPYSDDYMNLAANALDYAKSEFDSNNAQGGQIGIGVAYTSIDIALGLTPVVGFGKDIYESVTGRNLVTGQELSSFEYTFAIMGALSGGVLSKVGSFAQSFKFITKMISRTSNITAVAKTQLSKITTVIHKLNIQTSKQCVKVLSPIKNNPSIAPKIDAVASNVLAPIQKAIDTLPHGLKVKNIRYGTDPHKIAIIGRSMGDGDKLVGVRDAAAHINTNSNGTFAITFSPSNDLVTDFKNTVNNYRVSINDPNAILPANLVINTDLYKQNKAWAEQLKNNDFTVLDLGDPNGLNMFSPFYSMEKSVLFND